MPSADPAAAVPERSPRPSPGRRWVLLGVLLAGVFTVGWLVRPTEPIPKVPLRDLYTPTFRAAPPAEPTGVTIEKLRAELVSPAGARFVRSLLPGQSGVLWLSLVVALAVAFNVRILRDARNLDLLLALGIGFCFFDVLAFLDSLSDPTRRNLMDWVFVAVAILTLALLVRSVRRALRPEPVPWTPNLPLGVLALLGVVLFCLDVAVALAYPPDDAGFFINIGAQRLRERFWLPYGDPLLTETPAAAYGPILYLAHIPFQWLLSPELVNPNATAHPPLGPQSAYYLPPLLATQLCAVAFHALAVAALFIGARRLAGRTNAWAVVALYCGSAFVLGVGDGDYAIGGMTFISHIAPAAVTLAAFALLPRPAASGALLATGIGVLFYPVFMFPAWLGYYWRDRRGARKFLAGFLAASLLIGGGVLLRSRPANGRGVVGTVLWDTLGHQESPTAYGSSPFGLWGQRGGLRGALMQPLVDGQPMTRPVVLLFFLFVGATFFMARGRSPAQLALLVAAVAMGAEMWKVHATATYVTWYYPFLLIGLFATPGDARALQPDASEAP